MLVNIRHIQGGQKIVSHYRIIHRSNLIALKPTNEIGFFSSTYKGVKQVLYYYLLIINILCVT